MKQPLTIEEFIARRDAVAMSKHAAELASKDAEIERLRAVVFKTLARVDAGLYAFSQKDIEEARSALSVPPTAEGHADNIQTKGS